jgi:uncharacterized cupin superfamily protein
MNVVNAITKVRFNSAHAQRVQLQKLGGFACDLVCLEPGQEFAAAGPAAYYVMAGTGQLKGADQASALTMGSFAAWPQGQPHTIINSSEQRLICLAITGH